MRERSAPAPVSAVRVGVLAERSSDPDRPFGPLTGFAERLCQLAAQAGARVCLFDPRWIDLQRRRARCWSYAGPQAGWRESVEPLPEVIWSRYYRRDLPVLIAAFHELGLPLINEGWLDKWTAHQLLSREAPHLRTHLPHTRLATDAATIPEMARQYPVLFLKPIRGSLGRGIIRCCLAEAGYLRLEYTARRSREFRRILAAPEQVDRWLQRRGADRYLVQQGIDLNILYGRPADVRVLVQKDGSGSWRVTGVGARVAAHGRFTANLRSGGSAIPLTLLAGALYPGRPDRQEELRGRLESLALEIAALLERSGSRMGEIGLDLGVDRAGQIWYIEQNGQPGRSIFEQMGRRDLADLAHTRPLQYARWLTGRKDGPPGAVEAT